MLAGTADLLTWAVCRYCNIKYQSWAGVSSNRNWKPAEVMQGGSPGSALEIEGSWQRCAEKGHCPTCVPTFVFVVYLLPYSALLSF